jgi:XTP/dITP diphosphohydrolase
MQLLVGTRNTGKLTEVRAAFCCPTVELLDLSAFPDAPEVIEDGATFVENAVKKAEAFAAHTGCWTLADDSGLEVLALDGRPGVYSARYAGEPADPERNNVRLLEELAGVEDRRARFVCVLALAVPGAATVTVDGECGGRISITARGENGFGYDPVFIPDGYDDTFGELPAETKNRLSHRGRALRRAAGEWRTLLTARA